MVDWRQSTDYLRCSPSFHHEPRYDHIIFQTAEGLIFARLIFLFTCVIDKATYPIALVQPSDAPIGQRTRKDKDFGLYRVRARPRASTEFISVQSIIRGALLTKDAAAASSEYNDSFVVDVIDADMFLRMKAMNKGEQPEHHLHAFHSLACPGTLRTCDLN